MADQGRDLDGLPFRLVCGREVIAWASDVIGVSLAPADQFPPPSPLGALSEHDDDTDDVRGSFTLLRGVLGSRESLPGTASMPPEMGERRDCVLLFGTQTDRSLYRWRVKGLVLDSGVEPADCARGSDEVVFEAATFSYTRFGIEKRTDNAAVPPQDFNGQQG